MRTEVGVIGLSCRPMGWAFEFRPDELCWPICPDFRETGVWGALDGITYDFWAFPGRGQGFIRGLLLGFFWTFHLILVFWWPWKTGRGTNFGFRSRRGSNFGFRSRRGRDWGLESWWPRLGRGRVLIWGRGKSNVQISDFGWSRTGRVWGSPIPNWLPMMDYTSTLKKISISNFLQWINHWPQIWQTIRIN